MHLRRVFIIALLLAPITSTAGDLSVIATGLDGEPFNGPLRGLTLSPDGKTITFVSYATNVVATDDSGPTTNAPMRHWALDIDTGEFRYLGEADSMARSYSYASGGARITRDGRYAVFSVGNPEDYDPAVPPATGDRDLLVRLDLDTNDYVALPKALNGNYIRGSGVGVDYVETRTRVSPDGRYITFRWSTAGVTADQESSGGDFVWDMATESALLLTTPEVYDDSNPFPPSLNLIFLDDGRLLSSLPLPGSGGLEVPVVWTAIGAPPVQYFENTLDETVGLHLQQATPDGRYLVVEEDINVGSRTYHVDTQTDVWTSLCAHSIFGSGVCEATEISDDGRFVVIGKRLTDIDRDQTIQAVPVDFWAVPQMVGDGPSFVTVDRDGVIYQKTPHETHIAITTTMDSETIESTEEDGSLSFTYHVEGTVTIANLGAHPATNVYVQLRPERGAGSGSPVIDSDGDACDAISRCIVPIIGAGETWTATLEWRDTIPVRHRLEAEFIADEQWLTPPVEKTHESEIVVEHRVAPTPTPASSGGGGALGWWWLVAVVSAIAARRRWWAILGSNQ